MRNSLNNRNRGIRWKMTSSLEDLDFADDIVHLSSRHSDMQSKTEIFNEYLNFIGLFINQKKTKVLRLNEKNQALFNLGNQKIDDVDSFEYLGSIIDKKGGSSEDIKQRIVKARTCFRGLQKFWRSQNIQIKIVVYKAIVRAVLLYGAETWKMTKADRQRLEVFQNKCLKYIFKIFWPNIISNENLLKRAGIQTIEREIMKRRWSWLGHVLRMKNDNIPSVALTWAPEGKRTRGRPRLTYQRMVLKELRSIGISGWSEAKFVAKDRRVWRDMLEALYAQGHEEDK